MFSACSTQIVILSILTIHEKIQATKLCAIKSVFQVLLTAELELTGLAKCSGVFQNILLHLRGQSDTNLRYQRDQHSQLISLNRAYPTISFFIKWPQHIVYTRIFMQPQLFPCNYREVSCHQFSAAQKLTLTDLTLFPSCYQGCLGNGWAHC